MKKQTSNQHLHRRRIFCSLNSIRGLCSLLKIDQRQLFILAQKPAYRSFTVPKKDGGKRTIEVPNSLHKKVLLRLNNYLQSVYYFEKSSAAYGFIVGVSNDEDRRNVVTNARKHLNQPYLLNIDLKDFFHAVTKEQVIRIFSQAPFHFKRDLPHLLADLTTYQERLPMGIPTSPVLSNFACRQLDIALTTFAQDMLWAYTRYADDMSFSSKRPIEEQMIQSVRSIIKKNNFVVNERKVKLFKPDEPKIVTGLLVSDKVTLAPEYLPKLAEEIKRLQEVMTVQNEQGQLSTRWVEQFKKRVRGRLNFSGFVLGRRDKRYQDMKDAFYQAIHPPDEEFMAMSWRGFPYNM